MYNNNNYILSCTLSHINILKNAIKNNYKNYLVLEDDILIHKNIDIFPVESLHKWDLLYLGGTIHPSNRQYLKKEIYKYSDIEEFTKMQFKCFNCKINGNIGYKSNKINGTFAYAVNCDIYEKLLLYLTNNSKLNSSIPIDTLLQNFIENNVNINSYIIIPNLFISDVSDSDIREKRNFSNFASLQNWNISNYN